MPYFVIILYLIVIGPIFLLRLLPETGVVGTNDTVIALVCAIGCYYSLRNAKRLHSSPFERIGWRFLGFGLLADGLGHAWYSVVILLYKELYFVPQATDYYFMAGGVCFAFSIWNFNKQADGLGLYQISTKRWIANRIYLLIVLFNIVFVVYPASMYLNEPLWLRFIYIYYPVLDSLIVYICLPMFCVIFSPDSADFVKPLRFLVIAYVVFLLSDCSYTYMELHGNYHPYQWVNLGWGVAYLLLARASYLQNKQIKCAQPNNLSGVD